MSWIKRLGGRLPDFADVVRRFPIAVLIMAVFTLWIIFQSLSKNYFSGEEYIFGGFILCGYLAVIMQLMSEARGWGRSKGLIIALSVGLLAFLICYLAEKIDFNIPMAIAAAIVFLGNAAAFRMARHDSNVWNFTQKLWTGALFAAVGSGIFTLGMVAISEAMRSLFGVEIDKLTYEILLPIGLAFLAPIYWMGTLPRYGDVEDVSELSFEARALSFLGTWMLAPLVIIYSLIILAYGVKVLIQWELPKGEIAALVTPFLGVGMLVWLMLEPKVLKESGFVRFYRRIWHWVMLVATVLLAIAVFVRVREYGFTIERFLLTLIVFWGFAQALWFVFRSQEKRDIRVPTGIAAALLLVGAFSAQPISIQSQYNLAANAKSQLPSFEAKSFRQNPNLAKQFLGGLKYIVLQEDEKRFKRLVPSRDMPDKIYGPEYKALLKSLGLDKVQDDKYNRRARFSVVSEQPIEIIGDKKIYSASSVSLYKSRRHDSSTSIVTSQIGRNIVLTIEDETYRINFNDVFSDIELIGQDNDNIDVIVPFVPIKSNRGITATLIILNGSLSYEGTNLIGGNLSFIVVLPS